MEIPTSPQRAIAIRQSSPRAMLCRNTSHLKHRLAIEGYGAVLPPIAFRDFFIGEPEVRLEPLLVAECAENVRSLD